MGLLGLDACVCPCVRCGGQQRVNERLCKLGMLVGIGWVSSWVNDSRSCERTILPMAGSTADISGWLQSRALETLDYRPSQAWSGV